MGRSSVDSWLRRVLALALAAVLALSSAPVAALAEETGSGSGSAAAPETSQISVTVSVEVANDDGTTTVWLPPSSVTVEKGTYALVATEKALTDSGLSYVVSWGLNSITSTDGVEHHTEQDDEGNYVYWIFLVNGAYSNLGADGYTLQNGDAITWRYSGSSVATNPTGAADYDTATKPEEVEADWPTFETNDNVTKADTPTEVTDEWETLLGGWYEDSFEYDGVTYSTYSGSTVSEPIIVDGFLYVAVGSGAPSGYALNLVKVDTSTGKVTAKTPLAGGISATCRPTYAKGLVYVPLDGGAVQAVNPTTMKTYWVSASAADGGEATTSLKVHSVDVVETAYDENNDYLPTYTTTLRDVLFVGTSVGGATGTSGSLRGLDALTGSEISGWTYTNESAGFSWTNTVKVGDYVIAGDTAGTLYALKGGAYEPTTSTLQLDGRVNSDLATYGDDEVLVGTRSGTLYRVAVGEDGSLTKVDSAKVLSGIKGGPVVVGARALVGGVSLDGSTPAVAVVDLETMSVIKTITSADGAALPSATLYLGGVSAPVLVSVQDGRTLCYFTLNDAENPNDAWTAYESGGNVYWFDLDADTEAHLLYAPSGDLAQLCDSPLIADADGNLYYLNDSGYLVKLAKVAEKQDEDDKKQDDEVKPAPAATKPAAQQGVPATGDVTASGAAVAAVALVVVAGGVALRRRERE